MKVFGIIIASILISALALFITFQIIGIVKQIKNKKKNKNDKEV